MICLCLDPSLTKTGYALVRLPLGRDEGGIYRLGLSVIDDVFGIIKNNDAKESPGVRTARLYERLWQIKDLSPEPIRLIAAEIPPNLYLGTVQDQAGVQSKIASYTVVRLFAHHAKIPLLEVPPEQSKKFATGSAKADKTKVKEALSYLCFADKDAKWPVRWSEDALDALTVAFWLDSQRTLHLTGATTPLSPYL